MRTTRRISLIPNAAKRAELIEILESYRAEKQYWLDLFQTHNHIEYTKRHQTVRNAFVEGEYETPNGLQARMWKLALIDAADTMDRYWKSCFVEIRQLISRNSGFSTEQKKHCYRILKSYRAFQELLNFDDTKRNSDLVLDKKVQAENYLRRVVRRKRGEFPKSILARSMALDADCYKIFQHNGTQYIQVMTKVMRRRITIPLTGNLKISGNIRIVWDSESQRVEVHQTHDVQQKLYNTGECVGLDKGYTEAIATSNGGFYGTNLGEILTKQTAKRHRKGKHRNRLHALRKKALARGDVRKARKLEKYNLGRKKQVQNIRRHQSNVSNEINRGLNEFFKKEEPFELSVEKFGSRFKSNLPRSVNRRLASWSRGKLDERLEFKALSRCSRYVQVSAAYTSQMCSCCGFVDSKNRNGDRFQCQNCGHVGHADTEAAMNILTRMDDSELASYVSKKQIKSVLVERFHRRLESGRNSRTVPGRTQETIKPSKSRRTGRPKQSSIPGSQSESETKWSGDVCPHF